HDVVLPFAQGVMTRMQLRRLCDTCFRGLQAAAREAPGFVEDVARSEAVRASDIVGFSSTFAQHLAALAIARRVKELYPTKTIIVGGANCEGDMGQQILASFPFVDYVSSGPADRSFPAFAQALAEGREPAVAGIRGRCANTAPSNGGEEIVLDALPYPDYEDFFAAYERHAAERWRIYALPVEGARGCWWGAKHHCIFCGINGEHMAFRRKSARRFYDEINALAARYQVPRIWATDNSLDMHYFTDLIPLLRAGHRYQELFFEVKATLRRDQVQALAQAGITRLQPGIESLDTSVLRLMKKGTTALHNLQLLKWAAEAGITLQWNIICGFPGEDPAAYRRMYELARLIPHLPAPKACSQITIDRFSPLFNDPARFGIRTAPAKAYGYVYGLDSAAIAHLAYFHAQQSDHVDTTASLAVPTYAADLFHQTRIWQTLSGRVKLEYAVLPDGTVAVTDTRPGSAQETRRLTGLDAMVFRRLDDALPVSSVCTYLRSEGQGATAAAVRESLDRLSAWRYVYHENGTYLALATCKRTAPPAVAARAAQPSPQSMSGTLC
ncbi:MAG TPA: RiPP maturation radical SAM C-methyltransferase, partial [Burkholderiales bacterium]|nr:RiPP maturation radical SAM C-methyltransferase [Burkholderiales bacterium]